MSTVVMVVVLLVLLALQVDAQFTVDDDGVCQPFKWGDMVDLIKGELKDMKTVIQQQMGNGVSMYSLEEKMTNFREDVVRDVKTAIQQQMGSSMNTTWLHEDVRQIKEELQSVKTACASTQQQQQQQQQSVAVDDVGLLCKCLVISVTYILFLYF